MIKDSKLIGTKIKAPFGWKKFKVGELFDCKPLNRPEIAGYTGYVKDDMVISPYGHTPYLAATSDNNGISGYSDLKANNEANVITLSTTADSSNTIFYQEQEFIGRQQMEGLRLKSKVLTKNLAFYFIPFIKKQACSFNYGNKLTVDKLKNFILIIPVTVDNQPDFEWMSDYIKAVKADYLEQKSLSNRNEIEAYLSAGNTDSMVVTDDDRQFLRDFEKLPRKKFKVGELFDCKPLNRPEIAGYTGYVKDDMVISPYGHTPYLAATSDNNGISGYSDLKANNEANVITLSTTADSSNTIFYQEQEFIGRQQMEGLRLKSKVLTKNLAFYFIPFIKKQACLFNYGNKLTVNKLKNFIIIVPVIDSSQIDAQSIEKYMQIQIKLTIAKHAKYLDKELALMKTV